MEDKVQQLVRDLSNALLDAIADSPAVHAKLKKIRQEGYALCLLVDCKRDPEMESKSTQRSVSVREPVFMIDSKDLSFLRSIGIDPTRKWRGKRPSSS